MAYPKPEDDIPKGHPSQSTANRFPQDIFLRSRGWTIHERRRGQMAKWRYKHDLVVSEAEALEFEQFEREQKRKQVQHGA